MIMYSYERRDSISEISAVDSMAEATDLQQKEINQRFSDLSLKSLGGAAHIAGVRRRSARLSYDSDDMSMKSVGGSAMRSSLHRRFSHTGSLSGNSVGRSSPMERTIRRMSEMSIGEYSTITEDDKGHGMPTIFTIKEDNETEIFDSTMGLSKSYSHHNFKIPFGNALKTENEVKVDEYTEKYTHVNTLPETSELRIDLGYTNGTEFGFNSIGHEQHVPSDPSYSFNHDNVNHTSFIPGGIPQDSRRNGARENSHAKTHMYLQNFNVNIDESAGGSAENDLENAASPQFIQDELVNCNGRGPYGPLEQLVILVYGYQFFYTKNVYSIISRKMNYKRNRASVRQKLEQIVHKASGQEYGSLLHRRDEVLPILRKEFWRLLYECEAGTEHEQEFSTKIKQLAREINMPEQHM